MLELSFQAVSSVNHPAIVFLHIPKTAGQSVHHFLMQLVGKSAVAPARVNPQLYDLSVPELRRYALVSGHFDWALVDCVGEPKFVFTVLRQPTERILSFYFFMRSEAQKLSEAELALPENAGKRAVLRLSCDDYFNGGAPHIRTFLDNHYDNFYMYYFAGRSYDARQRLINRPVEKVMQMALDNMATLDGVYTIDRLDRLENDIRQALENKDNRVSLSKLHVNRGAGNGADRMAELKALGATEATFERLRSMVVHDEQIWQRFADR
ncbi:MAG TPA: sulfotransferase family 2 domain-containing protein [Rhizomicrobium sp.]|jgi:hypothetical protein|nr:sulfotransferase family 2 domain-containing protein [Rhizomicrobium sp.]